MNDRTLLLAGLVEEDNLEEARYSAVEDCEKTLNEDRKFISENVSIIEEDETRLMRLIGEKEKETEWEPAKKALNENIAMGGLGPGFANFRQNTVPYMPNQDEFNKAVLIGHKDADWGELDAKLELFRKIGGMSAYGFENQTINEDELPEFDENFNPKAPMNLSEMEALIGDELTEKRSELDNKLYNGEYAVEGGLGPGFQAYDGVKNEIKNPYESLDSISSRWYLGESEELDEMDPKRMARIKRNLSHTDKVLDQTEKRAKEKEQLDEIGYTKNVDLEKQRHQLENRPPEEELSDPYSAISALERLGGRLADTRSLEHEGRPGDYAAEVRFDRGDGALDYNGYGDSEDKAIVNAIKNALGYGMDYPWEDTDEDEMDRDIEFFQEINEQPDLPGEIEDRDLPTEHDEVPEVINLSNMTLVHVGDIEGLEVYSTEEDDLRVAVGQDPDGSWFAQAEDPLAGLSGEGDGPTVEDAVREAVSHYSGMPELPSSLDRIEEPFDEEPLMERVEGTSGNPWWYRRTGTPDDYHVRFDPAGKPTMNPEAPEEPSSEAWPGLVGWSFYKADPTYQKTQAQLEDPLDFGEVKLSELFNG